MHRLLHTFNTPVSNAPLVVWRVAFGLLLLLESWGAILTGWVTRNFVEPERSFTFIGFEWLQDLLGPSMYGYYVIMGFVAAALLLGWRYRLSAIVLALLWSGTYFMQKTSYNNHYYLTMLLCWWMVFLPAHRRFSLDALRTKLGVNTCAWWIPVFAKAQLLIVFVFGSVAKFYPGWLEGDFIRHVFGAKQHYWLIGPLLGEAWFQSFITYGAIVFDALVIPLLWWRPTRRVAFVGLVAFNLFNSVVFGIGIFPYLVLAISVFFFDERHFERLVSVLEARLRSPYQLSPKPVSGALRSGGLAMVLVYFVMQLALPVRHYFIPGDVNWREEGHRLSWRMMLRSKSGYLTLEATGRERNQRETVPLNDFLTPKQKRRVATNPYFLYRLAQDLEVHYTELGWRDVTIRAKRSRVWLNGKGPRPLYDPEVNLATVKWNRWGRNDWVLD